MPTDAQGAGLPWVEAIARSFEPISFAAFHRGRLPALIARNGHLVRSDLRGVASLAFRANGDAFTWVASEQGVQVVPGDAGATTVVELSEATFSEFIHELLTASGAVMTGRAKLLQGDLAGWKRWEPAIQSLCSGREIYGPAIWRSLLDRSGRPLDLKRQFSPGDDPEEMRAWFETAGFLHIKGVFSPAEVERYGAELEHVRARTTPGDPFSWWSMNAAGREVVTRINYLGRHSSVLQALSHDERLLRFARLAGPDLRVCDDRLDGPMAFIKNANVVKGQGDLGWHVDDGLGGHPVMCPLIQLGIQLDHANAANGQLKVLAGSQHYAKHWIGWGEEGELPAVALDTSPGDLTVHYGDTMHTTPPPTADDAGRRVLYYKFAEPKTFEWVPANCHYNDALFRRDAGGQAASRAAADEAGAAL
ncbi:MAG TPA: phytanoyl-CoA dioxygenase family protein [Myxococcota bacterium]|nr:phytanoyl-CoA dioxygenase family protein [Myxococcota bacterium]